MTSLTFTHSRNCILNPLPYDVLLTRCLEAEEEVFDPLSFGNGDLVG
jgi:hypothetical protein